VTSATEILSVTNAVAGKAPTVKFRVRDKGVAVDVKSLTAADGALSLGLAWSTKDFHNVADLGTECWRVPGDVPW